MKHCLALALGLFAFSAAAHPGHTEDPAESLLHALVGHAPLLAIGLSAGVVSLGLLIRFVRSRRRQLDRCGQLGM